MIIPKMLINQVATYLTKHFKLDKIMSYAHLLVAEDGNNEKNKIFYQLMKNNPDKEFFEAPTAGDGATCNSCSRCPWMGMNSLENLLDAVSDQGDEINVDNEIVKKAQISLNRMVNFK